MYDLFCSLIVLYHNNKILLQHRTSDAKILPDYWAFFGGGIKYCETPLQAVKRETEEELCYALKAPELFVETEFRIDEKVGYLFLYIEQFLSSKTISQQEGQAMRWVGESELQALKMINHDRMIAESVLAHIKNDKV